MGLQTEVDCWLRITCEMKSSRHREVGSNNEAAFMQHIRIESRARGVTSGRWVHLDVPRTWCVSSTSIRPAAIHHPDTKTETERSHAKDTADLRSLAHVEEVAAEYLVLRRLAPAVLRSPLDGNDKARAAPIIARANHLNSGVCWSVGLSRGRKNGAGRGQAGDLNFSTACGFAQSTQRPQRGQPSLCRASISVNISGCGFSPGNSHG